MKINWLQKLTSRKFLLALATFITALVITFGGTENTATQITSLVTAGATMISYIIGEGMVDASRNSEDERKEEEDDT